MSSLLSIDPGNTTGLAEFLNGRLVRAEACKKGEAKQLYIARMQVVIEMPRWYPHDHKDVNDLLDLSVFVGELKHHYEHLEHLVELVWPRTWKGNVPKEVTNRRALEALTSEERALLPRRPRAKDFDNNMLDAIGLGLWKIGRLR